MASPSWLDALHYHAVFSPVSDAPAASTSSSASTATPRQRLALLRANELLVAVGHQLRIASLTEAKSRAVEGKQGSYKTLITPAIDFSIDSLVVNPASKLVAVVGQQRVVVVVLPRKGWTGVVGDTIECRAIEVGRGQLGDVAQVRWHPWSTNGATLLVLTTDGQLLEYDVADDADRPVQTLDFCSGAGTSFDASFDLDEEAETAVSFCFGSGGGDWGALTVYGLMADGTIYSLCPYLPKAASVPLAYLRTLSVTAAIKPVPQDASPSRRQASKLAQALLAHGEDSAHADREGEAFVHVELPDDIARLHLARQGPYLFQPAPRELKGSKGSRAVDIAYLPPAADVAALIVTYSDGKVNVLLDLDRPRPRWTAKSASLPSLYTFETLDLGLTSLAPSSPHVLLDPFYEHLVHLHHRHGVHTLDLSPWLDPLRDQGGLDRVVQDGLATEVRWQVCTSSPTSQEPVVGLQVINDVYLGSFLLMFLPSRAYALELDLPDSQPADAASLPGSPSRPAKSSSQPASGYSSLLSTPFTSRPINLQTSHRVTSSHITTESLQQLGQVVTSLRVDIRTVVQTTNETQDRLSLQLQELPRQLSKLVELRSSMPKTEEGVERWEKAMEEQRLLVARADRLLQRLMEAYRPGVSDAERAWFGELTRMRNEVDRGLVRRVGKVREAIEATRPRAEALRLDGEAEGKMGSRQVQAVEAQLLVESRLIDAAKGRVETLQDRMSRLALASA